MDERFGDSASTYKRAKAIEQALARIGQPISETDAGGRGARPARAR